ncbi:hypothetical protein EB796_009415 [Bugula neritina]|uniref:Uncharacterized protein n=1 Tax=Bugula neritina TaxID=10212 RepID=A0A7J7K3W1_BUGNE|nr:hypothetical protein EB796_009415 [Bugula neritina]
MFSHLDNIPLLKGYHTLLLSDKCISSFQFSFQFAIDALRICHGVSNLLHRHLLLGQFFLNCENSIPQ